MSRLALYVLIQARRKGGYNDWKLKAETANASGFSHRVA